MTGEFERRPEESANAFAAFSVYPIMGAGSAIGEIESEEPVVDIEAMPALEKGMPG